MANAYSIAQFFGWKWGRHKEPWEAPRFTITWLVLFVLALAIVLPAWLAALIVAVVYAAIAGVLALRGKAQFKHAAPPMPQQAVESTKEDLEWVKTQAKASRS